MPKQQNSVPKEEGIDNTFNLMREGYMFITNRCHSFQSNIFETRLFGKKAICMRGKEAAELFYHNDKFKRRGAIPNWVVQSFFGENSVQILDGNVHQHRKDMLMSVMTSNRLQQLVYIIKRQWDKAIERWEELEQVILYEEVQKLLCKTACEWVGVPLEEDELDKRTKDLASLFESVASIGPAYWVGRRARNSLNEWIGELIEGIRSKKIYVHEDTIVYRFAMYQDLEGNLFKPQTAAVEVLNLLRPIVAISIFINFLMLAVHHYPEEAEKLKFGDEHYKEMFVQEVRRFYPFFPFIAALVKEDFIWKNYKFKEGTLMILDIYGTNHDPTLWENPDLFKPGRFKDWRGSPFGFIPQGGGDYWIGHRCAGEWLTIEVMKVSVDYLVNRIDYEVPDQDLSYSMVNMPSIPHSKVLIKNVKRKS